MRIATARVRWDGAPLWTRVFRRPRLRNGLVLVFFLGSRFSPGALPSISPIAPQSEGRWQSRAQPLFVPAPVCARCGPGTANAAGPRLQSRAYEGPRIMRPFGVTGGPTNPETGVRSRFGFIATRRRPPAHGGATARGRKVSRLPTEVLGCAPAGRREVHVDYAARTFWQEQQNGPGASGDQPRPQQRGPSIVHRHRRFPHVGPRPADPDALRWQVLVRVLRPRSACRVRLHYAGTI